MPEPPCSARSGTRRSGTAWRRCPAGGRIAPLPGNRPKLEPLPDGQRLVQRIVEAHVDVHRPLRHRGGSPPSRPWRSSGPRPRSPSRRAARVLDVLVLCSSRPPGACTDGAPLRPGCPYPPRGRPILAASTACSQCHKWAFSIPLSVARHVAETRRVGPPRGARPPSPRTLAPACAEPRARPATSAQPAGARSRRRRRIGRERVADEQHDRLGSPEQQPHAAREAPAAPATLTSPAQARAATRRPPRRGTRRAARRRTSRSRISLSSGTTIRGTSRRSRARSSVSCVRAS